MDNLDNNSNSVLYQWPHYYCSPFAGPPHHEYDDSYRHRDCFPPHDHPHRSLPHDHLPFCYGQPADNSSSRLMKTDKSLCLPSLQSTPVPAPSSTLSSPAAAADEKMTKPAPRTWKKPLDKPKRPLSAYNYFFQHHRSVVIDALKKKAVLEAAEEAAAESSGKKKKKKRHQRRSRGIGIGFAELAREVAFKWKKLESESKKEYEEQARLDKERYDKELDQWTLKTEKEDLEREEKERTQEEEQQQQVPEEAQVDEEEAKVVVAVRVESFGSSASMHNKSLLMADRVESFGSACSMTSVRRSLIMAERVTSFGTSGGYSGVPPPHHNLARSAVMADRVESFSGRNVLIPQDRRHVRDAHIEVEEEEDEEEAEAYAYENHTPYDDDSACEDHQDGAVSDADADFYQSSSLPNESEVALPINRGGQFVVQAMQERNNLCCKQVQNCTCADCNDKLIASPHPAVCSRYYNHASHSREYEKKEERVTPFSTTNTPSIRHDQNTRREELEADQSPTHGENSEVTKMNVYEYMYVHPSTVKLTPEISAWAEGFFDVSVATGSNAHQHLRPAPHDDDGGEQNHLHKKIDRVAPSSLEATPRPLLYGCHNLQDRSDDEERKEKMALDPLCVSPHPLCHPPSTSRGHCHSSPHHPYHHYRHHLREACDGNNEENSAPFVTPPPGSVDSSTTSPTSLHSPHRNYHHCYHHQRLICSSPYGEQRHDYYCHCAYNEYDNRESEYNKGESGAAPLFPHLSPWTVDARNTDHKKDCNNDATDDDCRWENKSKSSSSYCPSAASSPSSVFRQKLSQKI